MRTGMKTGAWGGVEQNGFGRGGFGKGMGGPVDASFEQETTVTVTDATYSDEAIAELLFMLEEEKLAGDIYDAFYEMYGVPIFDNIAESEDNHFDALLAQAESLGLDVDAIVFAEAGTYVDPELQEMYDTLLAQGSESLEAALEVGVAIETKDMVDIAAAAEAVADTPLADVYDRLLAESVNHLDAFEALL